MATLYLSSKLLYVYRQPPHHVIMPDKQKKTLTACFLAISVFPLWTSLGLNQGPPDYESEKLIFHELLF